jgi:hypothetical protein
VTLPLLYISRRAVYSIYSHNRHPRTQRDKITVLSYNVALPYYSRQNIPRSSTKQKSFTKAKAVAIAAIRMLLPTSPSPTAAEKESPSPHAIDAPPPRPRPSLLRRIDDMAAATLRMPYHALHHSTPTPLTHLLQARQLFAPTYGFSPLAFCSQGPALCPRSSRD